MLMIIGLSSFAQELKLVMPNASYDCKSFNWKNGDGVYVEVKFEYYVNSELLVGEPLTDEQFDNAVATCMTKAKFACKNKLSFVPKKFTIMEDGDLGGYSVMITLWASNNYGVKDDKMLFYVVDSEGKVTALGK